MWLNLIRYGGLNHYKQKGNYTNDVEEMSFHTAPEKFGCYAFLEHRVALFLLSGTAQDLGEDTNGKWRLTKRKKFKVNGQTFDYTAIKNKLGGYRWFFCCPKCGRRSSKLFLPPEGSSKENLYLCKRCHKLKNQSSIFGQNSIYKRVTRPLKRLDNIAKRLERGYLSPERVKELLDEYDAIEKRLKSSQEYRLYAFKKKRGMDV